MSYCDMSCVEKAYNAFVTETILTLDVCSMPAPLLPGGAWVDSSLPLAEAAAAAREYVMDELTPDNPRSALLLCDDEECSRAIWVHAWLLDSAFCTDVLRVERKRFAEKYGFLLGQSASALESYPNEVCHNVFLGSAACVNAAAVANLRVSHVLSIVDRRMAAPPGTTHRLCRVPDEESADLTPVMRVALPFLAAALRSGGRVLVHCDRGASRSASVVIAHLMQHGGLDLPAALSHVKQHRPCVRPNSGFMRQLETRAWVDPP